MNLRNIIVLPTYSNTLLFTLFTQDQNYDQKQSVPVLTLANATVAACKPRAHYEDYFCKISAENVHLWAGYSIIQISILEGSAIILTGYT